MYEMIELGFVGTVGDRERERTNSEPARKVQSRPREGDGRAEEGTVVGKDDPDKPGH